MDTKHTLGPWRINEKLDAGTHAFVWGPSAKGDTRLICDCSGISYRTYDEMKANAHLIAAAPHMLTVLQTISLHAPSLDVEGIRELCDEAITSATGTQK